MARGTRGGRPRRSAGAAPPQGLRPPAAGVGRRESGRGDDGGWPVGGGGRLLVPHATGRLAHQPSYRVVTWPLSGIWTSTRARNSSGSAVSVPAVGPSYVSDPYVRAFAVRSSVSVGLPYWRCSGERPTIDVKSVIETKSGTRREAFSPRSCKAHAMASLPSSARARAASFPFGESLLWCPHGLAQAPDMVVAALVAVGQRLAAFEADSREVGHQIVESTCGRKDMILSDRAQDREGRAMGEGAVIPAITSYLDLNAVVVPVKQARLPAVLQRLNAVHFACLQPCSASGAPDPCRHLAQQLFVRRPQQGIG